MPPTKVYLIGETHFDLRKAERYARAFGRFRPDVITVEASEQTIASYGGLIDGYVHDHPNVERHRIEFMRCLCEGSFGPAFYYQRLHNGVTVVSADYSSPSLDMEVESINSENMPSQLRIAQWKEIATDPSVGSLLLMQAFGIDEMFDCARKGINFQCATVKRLVEIIKKAAIKQISEVSQIIDCLYLLDDHENYAAFQCESRDEYAAAKIMEQNGVVVHSGGLDHVFGENFNLYERLKTNGLNVERYQLLDFAYEPFGPVIYKRELMETIIANLGTVKATVLEAGSRYLSDIVKTADNHQKDEAT